MARQAASEQLSAEVPPGLEDEGRAPSAWSPEDRPRPVPTDEDSPAVRPIAQATRSRPRAVLRAVAVPSEHGGWGLTAEPVPLASVGALGALVAWQLWSSHRPPARIGVLGAGQMAAGLCLVLVTAFAVRPW